MSRTVLLLSAFVAISLAVKCYEDFSYSGIDHTSNEKTIDCESSCKFCMKAVGKSKGEHVTTWGCGCDETKKYGPCKETGSKTTGNGDTSVEIACCKGDKCNSSGHLSVLISLISSLLAYSIFQ